MAIKVNNKLQMSKLPSSFDLNKLAEIAKQYYPFEEEATLKNIKMALTPENFGEEAKEMLQKYGEDPLGFLDEYGYAMGQYGDTIEASGFNFEDWANANVPNYQELVDQFEEYANENEFNYYSIPEYIANEYIYPYHQNWIKETRDPKSPRRAETLKRFKGLK